MILVVKLKIIVSIITPSKVINVRLILVIIININVKVILSNCSIVSIRPFVINVETFSEYSVNLTSIFPWGLVS